MVPKWNAFANFFTSKGGLLDDKPLKVDYEYRRKP
jgi:hypothetical protein